MGQGTSHRDQSAIRQLSALKAYQDPTILGVEARYRPQEVALYCHRTIPKLLIPQSFEDVLEANGSKVLTPPSLFGAPLGLVAILLADLSETLLMAKVRRLQALWEEDMTHSLTLPLLWALKHFVSNLDTEMCTVLVSVLKVSIDVDLVLCELATSVLVVLPQGRFKFQFYTAGPAHHEERIRCKNV